jgi:hypothetical protein
LGEMTFGAPRRAKAASSLGEKKPADRSVRSSAARRDREVEGGGITGDGGAARDGERRDGRQVFDAAREAAKLYGTSSRGQLDGGHDPYREGGLDDTLRPVSKLLGTRVALVGSVPKIWVNRRQSFSP